MSLDSFIRLTATAFKAPLASTRASRLLCAWKWLSVSLTGIPSMPDSLAHTLRANSGCVFTPVPTAVPPRATSDSSSSACRSRPIPRSICPAYP